MKRLLAIALIIVFQNATAQTGRRGDAFLQKLGALAAAVHAASQQDNSDYTALEKANDALRSWLLREGVAHPEWLAKGSLDFDSAGLHVLTSADRRFRIYSWDTETGGTMHFFSSIVQYLAAPGHAVTVDLDDEKTMEDGGDPGRWYQSIHSVKTKSGATFYLSIYHGVYSTRDLARGIQAYTIQNGKLRDDVPLFFTKTKHYADISYNYDFFESGVEAIPQISLVKGGKELLIPVVVGKGKVTTRSLVYRFDGEKFVYTPAK